MLDEKKMLAIIEDRKKEIENTFDFEIKTLYRVLKDGYTLKNCVKITIEKAGILKPLLDEYNRILSFREHTLKHSDCYSLISEAIAKTLKE